MPRKCPGTNIPSVNEDPIECCNLISSNCVVMAEAVPCLQLGKGKTLTEAFERLCKNLRPVPGSSNNIFVEAGDNVTVDVTNSGNTTIYTVNADAGAVVTAGNNVTVVPTVVAGVNYYEVSANTVVGPQGPQGPAGMDATEGIKFYHTHLLFEPDFSIPTGYPLLSGAAITVGSAVTTKLSELDMTEISPGDYLMTLELNLDASPEVYINVTYELRKNGVRIPHSTRVFRLTGGTPADEQSHVGVSAPVSIGNTTDTIEVWISNHYVGNGSLVVAGGSLTALRK